MQLRWLLRLIWIGLGGALVGAALLFAPDLRAHPLHTSLEDCRLVRTNRDGTRLFLCPPEATAPPRPTSAPQRTATPTRTQSAPAPTNTQPPAGPTATPLVPTNPAPPPTQPSGSTAPYPGAPLCPSHDPRAYHSLWDSARGCHFDHHHGDDPRVVDDLFGTEIYARMGGEISYPWQTFSVVDGVTYLENDAKHAGYFWYVRRDIPCDPNPGNTPAPCITAFRVLVHQHQTGRDATVRYHSYTFEANTSDGGYFSFSGWADFGDLHAPEGTVIVDFPDNHDSFGCNGAGRHKQHSVQGGPNQLIWYGASLQYTDQCGPRGFATVSISGEPFDYTDPADPARFDDYTCWNVPNPRGVVDNTRCTLNGTSLRPHLISINMVSLWNGLIDADGDGIVTWTGYADRYGRLLPSDCPAYGVDCVPVVFRGLRAGHTYGSANSHTALSVHDHDIYFCNGVQCGPRNQGSRSAGWNQPVP